MKQLDNKGETLVETLVAILILSIVITGFSNVIATTAKLNAVVRDQRVVFTKSEYTTKYEDWEINLTTSAGTKDYQCIITYYDPKSKLYYYEAQ